MKLNFEIIIDHMPKSFKHARLGTVFMRRTLTSPVIYEAGSTYATELLYVVQGEALPDEPPMSGLSVVCVGGKPPPSWTENDCQILWITESAGLFSVFNEINGLFNRFNQWESSIIEEIALSDNFDIKRILRAGAEILGNPMSIVNSSLLALFTVSTVNRDGTDEFDIDIVSTHKSAYKEIVKDVYRMERTFSESYFSSVSGTGYRVYCKNLFLHDKFIGCIAVSEQRKKFRASDISLAEFFFRIFQSAFIKHIRTAPQVEAQEVVALKNYLNGVPLSASDQAQLTLGKNENWIYFILRHQDTSNYMPLQSMCATLNVMMNAQGFSVVRDEEIHGIMRLRGDSKSPELEYYQKYFFKMDYTGGFSTIYRDIEYSGIHMEFARYALSRHENATESNPLFWFEDCVLDYIITGYAGNFPAEHLYSQGFLSLLEHDKNSSVNYINTLNIFLENGMNISMTAEVLSLHRSSLVSRLEKISKRLDVDLKDSESRLYIQLCLYLWEKENR